MPGVRRNDLNDNATGSFSTTTIPALARRESHRRGPQVDQACPSAIANDTTIMHANAKLRFMKVSSIDFKSGAILTISGRNKKFGFMI
jgi:hypothetical protein